MGLPEHQTHDYKRYGTATLFAAFNILNSKVIGTYQERHRSREFVRFLNRLEKNLPADQQIHLIMDKYSTHKSAEAQRWLKPKKRQHFHFHFTPTSSSWLNQVERFFALITERMIRRGTFHSAQELETAIYQWLAHWNSAPTPFVWKSSADVILDKVRRCKELAKTGNQIFRHRPKLGRYCVPSNLRLPENRLVAAALSIRMSPGPFVRVAVTTKSWTATPRTIREYPFPTSRRTQKYT